MKEKMQLFVLLSTGLIVSLVQSAYPADELATIPEKRIPLLHEKGLSHFYTWLVPFKHEDPDRVFTMVDSVDGAPALRVSGQHMGGLITKKSYRDYHLVVEFRWGLGTWGQRRDKARDSGILLHCQHPEGNASPDFDSPWMQSVEFQIIEGGTGDFIVIPGYSKDGAALVTELTADVSRDRDGEYLWDPEGEARTFSRGRINWYGRDSDWQDALGFRGQRDIEKPPGHWNRLDAYVDGDKMTFVVNGTVVNMGYDCSLNQGRILIQSEGAEIYFRRIDLFPLP
jgi:hypothetical protein